jgi:hypothetical protein
MLLLSENTVRYFKRDFIHIIFIIAYCHVVLLLVVANLFLCLTYKLNFSPHLDVWENYSTHRVLSYLWFQASTGGFGPYP